MGGSGSGGARLRLRTIVSAACPSCSAKFDSWTPSGPFKTYCSARCKETAFVRRHADPIGRRARGPAKGRAFEGPPDIECRLCHSPLTSSSGRNGVGRLAQRYCSPRCRLTAQVQRHPDRRGRGAGRRFPRVRYAARLAIFERDGWICQLCGAPIDRGLTFPHPGSATIDHRDPDGPHDPTNWQSAHLACNTSKGRKVAIGADPALRRIA